MGSAVMNGEHLDVLMIAAPVHVLVLDSNVRKMDLVIEVRQRQSRSEVQKGPTGFMATNLDTLLEQFLRERKYLRNVSPETIEWYRTAWKAFGSATSCPDPHALNRSHLEQFIYTLRDRGVKPVTCNTWLRALNAFFRWMH